MAQYLVKYIDAEGNRDSLELEATSSNQALRLFYADDNKSEVIEITPVIQMGDSDGDVDFFKG